MKAEKKIENTVKTICKYGHNLLILCRGDELISWDFITNSIEYILVSKNQDQHLNMLAVNGAVVLTILGASIAKFEIASDYNLRKEQKHIVSIGEVPELTVAVRYADSITVQKHGFCSEPVSLDKRVHHSFCLTMNGAYILNEFGGGYCLPPNQLQFQSMSDMKQAIRILKSFPATDNCVYYIDTLWNLSCGQSNYSYDLSQYHLSAATIRALKEFVLILGTGHGVNDASTGHVTLSGKLLIFQTDRPGFLRFCGAQSFSSTYGVLIDAAFHEESNRFYLMFNTPYSAKAKDLLHVCFGTKEELLSGEGNHADINIGRSQDANPSTACAGNNYLVCYQGNIYAYDAVTLKYQAALAVNGSFNSLQASQNNGMYALALCNNSTEIKKIIPY
jgi:hypothetical protein